MGLRGLPDTEVFNAALGAEAIIITRDRGFTHEQNWPADFNAGVIFVNLPDDAPAALINTKIIALLTKRLPESLLGAITFVEPQRALSRILRRRLRPTTTTPINPNEQEIIDETFDAQLDATRTD